MNDIPTTTDAVGTTEGTRAAAVFAGERGPGSASRESEGLYRLLVESVHDYAIFALDPTGHILTWNAGARRFKGYTAEEIIGKHFSIFYTKPDLDRGRPAEELEIATKEGRVEDEGWRLRKDGSRFWANVVITALRDPSGSLVGFAKVTRDLTERRRAEQALRTSEERFRLLIENIRDYGIFTLDTTGRVTSWNAGAEQVSGYKAPEIIGRHFSTFYPPEDVAARKPERELEIVQRDGRFEEEGWRIRKGGGRFWSNVVITAIYDQDGTLVGYAKVTRDLTERREANERALADARRVAAAESANRTKSEFLAAMSHELRTPLNAIGGYAELLTMGLGGPVSGEQSEYLDRIRRSQQHLLGIINDILNFSRIEAGQVSYDIRPVALAEIVEAVVPMITPQVVTKGIAITTNLGQAMAHADRGKLEQVLLNLLSNAAKFTMHGEINISTFVEEDRAGLRVRDTGIGIPRDKLSSIFEPFVQVGRSLTTPHEGTGLGLAISRDLTRAMGGELTVKSAMGKGTVFSISLKRA
ncbi:MAG TPA: PAS domain S-box protein [Gemmatimonadaceae bacterium]|nr:PAS domain S-box protein [Gemmatimonadaceae bacterium]